MKIDRREFLKLTAAGGGAVFASALPGCASMGTGGDTPDFQRFLIRTTSGAVSRNDTALAYLNHAAPFGGVGMSGSGAYHGKAGYDTYSHQRPIAQSDLPVNVAGTLIPPLAPERVAGVAAAAAAAAAEATARLA